MSVSMQITHACKDGDGAQLSDTETINAGGGPPASESIPGPSTDLELDVAFTNTKLQAIYMLASVDMTVYTNAASNGAFQDKINLKAGRALSWSKTGSWIGLSTIPSPFGGDVTKMYVNSTILGTLEIRTKVDTTPSNP